MRKDNRIDPSTEFIPIKSGLRMTEKGYFISAILVIIFFITYNIVLAFGSLEGSPKNRTGNGFFPYLNEKPLTEDGFYMLTVAWNIAAGKGIVYNYNIKTTGTQPLATFFYSVPAYFVQSINGNKYLFVRFVLILSAFLQVLFAYLIYRIAVSISKASDKGIYFLLSVLIVLLNFKVLLNFENGLETGLYLILLSVLVLYWVKFISMQPGINHILGMGLLSGLLLLCRLDAVIILFFFYGGLLITKRIKAVHIVALLLIAFIIYLPWELYVWSVTDNLLQSSVRSQTTFFEIQDKPYHFNQYFLALIQHLTPFLYTGNIKDWLMYLLGIPYIIVLARYYRSTHLSLFASDTERSMQRGLVPVIILLIIYLFFSRAPYFYYRYTAYLMIFSLPVCIVLFTDILLKVNKHIVKLLLFIPLITFLIQASLFFHSGKSAMAISVRPGFFSENFDSRTRAGALQTGILGFYYENVFNLDGKMDNTALKSITEKRLEYFIDSMKIDVIIEWKDLIPGFLKEDYLKKYWQVYKEDIGDGRTICYIRKKIQNSK